MNDPIREDLSALMDGELASDRARFLLRRLDADTSLSRTWARYHLVRDCLRRQHGRGVSEAFAASVMTRIGDSRPERSAPSWLRPVAGGLIAAGVAAAALLLVSTPTPAPSPAVTVAAVEAPAASPTLAVPTPLRTDDLEIALPLQRVADRVSTPLPPAPAVDAALERYLVRHGEAAGAGARGGFVPYVYVVAAPVRTVRAAPEADR